MRVAIAGAGNVGLFIANDLAGAGHEVLVIEQNPAVVARSEYVDDIDWYTADACEVSCHAIAAHAATTTTPATAAAARSGPGWRCCGAANRSAPVTTGGDVGR